MLNQVNTEVQGASSSMVFPTFGHVCAELEDAAACQK